MGYLCRFVGTGSHLDHIDPVYETGRREL